MWLHSCGAARCVGEAWSACTVLARAGVLSVFSTMSGCRAFGATRNPVRHPSAHQPVMQIPILCQEGWRKGPRAPNLGIVHRSMARTLTEESAWIGGNRIVLVTQYYKLRLSRFLIDCIKFSHNEIGGWQ